MGTRHTVVIGDSRSMAELPDESVHLIVTSPPYWQLKDYGCAGAIGYNDSYESYINNLNLVWMECVRVLHGGCRLCVNVGDQFARSVFYGRYKVLPIRTEIVKFCEAAGLDYLGAVIWQKRTTTNSSGGGSVMGSYPFPRNGMLTIDYEFILVFKKPGAAPAVTREVKERSRLSAEEWRLYFSGHWAFPGARQRAHIAMFPEELPRRLIRMFSFVGDTVLDPFLGSGTTSLAARSLGRNSVGYEINGDFVPVIRGKLDPDGLAVEEGDVRFVGQEPFALDAVERTARLPYVFRDPAGLDRRVDPKRFGYGSKIDAGGGAGRTLPEGAQRSKVREVISPDVLLLSDGRRVRLLGVRPRQERFEEALRYLRERVRGRNVVITFEEGAAGEPGPPPCYVHLRDRTFVNAHLIKRGLADVDDERHFRHRARFLSYRKPVLEVSR